jgi:hypothetical protein
MWLSYNCVVYDLLFYIIYYFIILLYEYTQCREGSRVSVGGWVSVCRWPLELNERTVNDGQVANWAVCVWCGWCGVMIVYTRAHRTNERTKTPGNSY